MIEPLILDIYLLDLPTVFLDTDRQLAGGRRLKPGKWGNVASFFSDHLEEAPAGGFYTRSFLGHGAATTAGQTETEYQSHQSHILSPIGVIQTQTKA